MSSGFLYTKNGLLFISAFILLLVSFTCIILKSEVLYGCICW